MLYFLYVAMEISCYYMLIDHHFPSKQDANQILFWFNLGTKIYKQVKGLLD